MTSAYFYLAFNDRPTKYTFPNGKKDLYEIAYTKTHGHVPVYIVTNKKNKLYDNYIQITQTELSRFLASTNQVDTNYGVSERTLKELSRFGYIEFI